jgi:hypothetical protein
MHWYVDPKDADEAINRAIRENMAFSASRSATEVYIWSRLASRHVRVDAMLYSARPIPSR